MKRISVLLLALVVLTTALFAQGVKDEAEGKVTLSVLNYIDMSEPNSANEVKMIWDKFEAENPDIKIDREDLFGEPFHTRPKRTSPADSCQMSSICGQVEGRRACTLPVQ
ncbi:MAG TPA: hypothetical protein VFC80_00685 [Sphaerochaeta sp.]|nr:hypothetical protein [Sphaerochaeta sp.]